MDNTGSTNDVNNALDNVVFTNNTLINVHGSIAFRGNVDNPIDNATINNNTANYDALSSFWAFVEVNNVEHVEAAYNVVHGISAANNADGWGENQVFQFWSKAGP